MKTKKELAFNEIMRQMSEQQSEDFKRIDAAAVIMEKFVNKVETGRARSKETYAEMKAWLEERDTNQ